MSLIEDFVSYRFGMFIHFGIYSVAGGIWKGREQGRNRYAEWLKYQALWPDGGATGRSSNGWTPNSVRTRSSRASRLSMGRRVSI